MDKFDRNFFIFIYLFFFSFLSCSVKAKLFILIGPSGVGKSVLIKNLIKQKHIDGFVPTYTTRSIRLGEQNAKDYFFITEKDFFEKVNKNEFVHHENIYGNYYGISQADLMKKLEKNENLIMTLIPTVAQKIKTIFGQRVVTIFITPPTFQDLEQRLISRMSEDQSSLKIRIEQASKELAQQDLFDYKIMNDDLKTTLKILRDIIDLECL
ncbi:guanylate kinase [Candidatus Dependentiae bacterium]|nr:guanylate kinase [Candidatus Dependentiae bacterium]